MRYDAPFSFAKRASGKADRRTTSIQEEDGMFLTGQVALITGASSGIGQATAEAMAREGARVAVNYLKNQKGAEETVEAIRKAGGEAVAIRADVTRQDEVRALVAEVRKQFGRIDILVNNAGDLIARRTLADMTEEYWDQIMDRSEEHTSELQSLRHL